MMNSDFSGELNIVIVGDFNPKIFQPSWFAKEELISESDAESADISVIHPDITAFRLDWLDFQVSREKLIAQTSKEYSQELLRDLIKGTFQLLSHTPVSAMGINFARITNLGKGDRYEKFIEKLYPDSYWSSIFENPELEEIKIIGNINEETSSHNRITIKPLDKYQIYTSFNNHFQIAKEKQGFGEQIPSLIDNFWEDSKKKEHNTFKNLFDKTT